MRKKNLIRDIVLFLVAHWQLRHILQSNQAKDRNYSLILLISLTLIPVGILRNTFQAVPLTYMAVFLISQKSLCSKETKSQPFYSREHFLSLFDQAILHNKVVKQDVNPNIRKNKFHLILCHLQNNQLCLEHHC